MRVELFLFRHGQTDWNAEGRIQGHLDVPLNEVGREQARRLIEPLQKLGVEAFLSSDLSRAHETASIIASPMGLTVERNAGLREIHLGQLQGLTRQEIEEKFGTEFSERLRHTPLSDADMTHLGSESAEAVVERSLKAIAAFVQSDPKIRRVGICTHGGVIRRLVQASLGSFPPPTPNGVLYPFFWDLEKSRLGFLGVSPFFRGES